jgi:hypothetical protein
LILKDFLCLCPRDIIIKDLNPGNVLLDGRGHIKLTYQCEWVSVERRLAAAAIQGRYAAPEVSPEDNVK